MSWKTELQNSMVGFKEDKSDDSIREVVVSSFIKNGERRPIDELRIVNGKRVFKPKNKELRIFINGHRKYFRYEDFEEVIEGGGM